MKKQDITVSVVVLAEGAPEQAIDKTLKDIFSQTWRNIEAIVTYTKGKDFDAMKDRWLTFPANIFWCECDNVGELLVKPFEFCKGDYIFYKSVNPIIWYPRHVEHHLEMFEESRFEGKWSYSLLEMKDAGVQEPMNNIGWRIDMPKIEQALFDEFCHSKDVKVDWNTCIAQQNGVTQFVPGLLLKTLKNYRLVNPKEITITFYVSQQQQQQVVLGAPANDNIKETIAEINGDMIITKSYPTIVGNVQFSERNKNLLSQVNADEVFNIAVKRSMGMGDVLLTEPVIRALKKKYKNAKIKLFTTAYSTADQLVKLFPALDSFEIIGQDKLTTDYLSTVEGFNLKFDLDLSYESRPGVRYIDGYLEVCGFTEELQEVNGELAITRGVNDDDLIPQLNYNKEPIIKEKYISVELLGSGWGGKEWPVEKWNNILTKIKNMGYKFAYISNVKMGLYTQNVDYVNTENNFNTVLNYVKYADFHIGSDAGPLHIASAFNKPTFIISGAALSKYTTPSKKVFSVSKEGLDCLGCKHKIFYEQNGPNLTFVPRCTNPKQYECMQALEVDYVLNKFEEFLKVNNIQV